MILFRKFVRVQNLIRVAFPRAHVRSSCRGCYTSSRRRGCTSTSGGPFSSSLGRRYATGSSKRHGLSGRKMLAEKLWREFLLDPSQWWDNRSEKVNPRYPDFEHKKTKQSLWLDNNFTPQWVEAKLAAVTPGTLQSHIFSWNAKLRRYVRSGDHEKTMELFQQMQREGMTPDKFTFVSVLKACSGLQSLDEGRSVHEQIIQRGYQCDVYVATCLVDMYAKCRRVGDAWSVFSKMRAHDVVSWNAMIGGYVKCGQGLKALELFRTMDQEGVEPDTVTFLGVLNACACEAALEEGRCIHERIIRRGYESGVCVATCLVDMYAKCGSMEDAWGVFKKMPKHDVCSWSAIIGGYVKSRQALKAIELFHKMQDEGVEPNEVTFVGVLNACAILLAPEEGKSVHKQLIERGYESDDYVANCLVDMYAKCGCTDDAWSVFNKMSGQNVISWNAMIGGYVKSGQGLKAVELFRRMQQERVEPDTVTFVGVLKGCASVAALDDGRRVHEQVILRRCESDVYVATCLVDMYAKCGSLEDACSVFNKMGERDVVSWNAMFGGYAKHGHAKKAIGLFKQMGKELVKTDGITFTYLLSACSHGGLVKEGLRYFKSMTLCHNIVPTVEHYACMVDLLGRAGQLEGAEEMIKRMPVPVASLWMALFGACMIHGDTQRAERAARWCLELDAENASGHERLWNIYATDRSAASKEERFGKEYVSRIWSQGD